MTDRSADLERLRSYVIDVDYRIDGDAAVEPAPEVAATTATSGAGSEKVSRRKLVLAGVAGTALVGAPLYIARRLVGDDSSGERAAAHRPRDAGGFANRDESYASTTKVAEPAPDPLVYPTASEAAEATEVVVPTILATDDPVLHLLRRVTFGPSPALVDEVHTEGIDAWLAEQLDPESIPDDTADEVWALFPQASMGPAEIHGMTERYHWDAMYEYGQATLARQVWSRRQLFEVMVDFWADHLHVATPGPGSWDVAASYYNDVIRRHTLGSFTDMLLAAMQHPAMLRYLTNDQSDKEAVNENLGRELLELHTVGVASGYTEDDVRNSAYILTGRTVTDMDDMHMHMGDASTFMYDPDKHWTGAVRVLDFQHANATPEGGMAVGDEYLRYLATHPSTAWTIAHKLAVRFVADSPPDTLLERLATTYLEAGTEIRPVLDILFRSAEFWAAVGQKTRRPLENLVAAARVLDVRPGDNTVEAVEGFYWRVQQMGHRPLAWPAPDGYPDVHPAWRSAGGVLASWNAHRGLVQGWHNGATYVAPDQLTAGMPQATAPEYVDSLCRRLCFQTFQPAHRDTLIAFVSDDLRGMKQHVAPLVLDSPYFALR